MPKVPGRPRLHTDIYMQIEDVFVRLVTEKGGTHPTAARVYQSLRTKDASKATVRRYVRLLKEKYPDQGGRPYRPGPWAPSWCTDSPENIALLFALNRSKLRAQLWRGQQTDPIPLYEHEAKWALRVHPSLEGSHEMIELL